MMRPTASSESSFASSFTRLIFRSFCRLFRLLNKKFKITKTDWGGFHLFTSLTQIQACQWCAEGQGSSSTRSCSSPPWCWSPPAGSSHGGSSLCCHSALGSRRCCPCNAMLSLAFYQQLVPHPAEKVRCGPWPGSFLTFTFNASSSSSLSLRWKSGSISSSTWSSFFVKTWSKSFRMKTITTNWNEFLE